MPYYVNLLQSGEEYASAKSNIDPVIQKSLDYSLSAGIITKEEYDKAILKQIQANLGMMVRFEFGVYVEKYPTFKKDPRKDLIVGAPSDAIQINAMKTASQQVGIKWHMLDASNKQDLVSDGFMDAIIQKVQQNIE
ncbi:hypothetical protein HOK00_09975 [bacterium]|jgi:hypothetical protein|nr:hypothetical protein [bacterium]